MKVPPRGCRAARSRHRIDHRAQVRFVQPFEQGRAAERGRARGAVQRRGRGVGEHDPVVLDDEDAQRRVLDQLAVAPLALPHALFGLDARGDVARDDETVALTVTLRVGPQLPSIQHQDAVGAAHAIGGMSGLLSPLRTPLEHAATRARSSGWT